MNGTFIKGGLASVALIMSACGTPPAPQPPEPLPPPYSAEFPTQTSAPGGNAAPVTSTAPAPSTTVASGPVSTFSDGMWQVGSGIAPGTYQAPGGKNCYWELLPAFGANTTGLIEGNKVSGQVIVTILSTDEEFSTQGCGTWTKTS